LQSNLIDAFDRFYSDLRGTRYREVVTHRDLGSDHILWDSKLNRPSGVIDWGDTCLCDPAFDLIALGGMGLANLDEWARVRGADIDSTFDSRLSFYRRVWPVHGALYAAATRNAQLFRDSVARLAANFDR
jgi:aminoglycoside 2''-phosphotransferase